MSALPVPASLHQNHSSKASKASGGTRELSAGERHWGCMEPQKVVEAANQYRTMLETRGLVAERVSSSLFERLLDSGKRRRPRGSAAARAVDLLSHSGGY